MLRIFGFEVRKNVKIQVALKTICFRLSGESYYCVGNYYLGWNLRHKFCCTMLVPYLKIKKSNKR